MTELPISKSQGSPSTQAAFGPIPYIRHILKTRLVGEHHRLLVAGTPDPQAIAAAAIAGYHVDVVTHNPRRRQQILAHVDSTGCSARVRLQFAELGQALFDEETFDAAWIMGVVSPAMLSPLIGPVRQWLRPGGVVAFMARTRRDTGAVGTDAAPRRKTVPDPLGTRDRLAIEAAFDRVDVRAFSLDEQAGEMMPMGRQALRNGMGQLESKLARLSPTIAALREGSVFVCQKHAAGDAHLARFWRAGADKAHHPRP